MLFYFVYGVAIHFSYRLPKFKAEVKKMIEASLPLCITGYLAYLREQPWRSNKQTGVFLSKGGISSSCPNLRTSEKSSTWNLVPSRSLHVISESAPFTPTRLKSRSRSVTPKFTLRALECEQKLLKM